MTEKGDSSNHHPEPGEGTRPWGSYEVLTEAAGYKVKRVIVQPGHRLSLQYHHRRAEHWVVVAGEAQVIRNDETIRLLPGQCVSIPQGANHRVGNPGSVPLIFIEVQRGDYLGEDDIVRLQDDYSRHD